ncbi:MAG: alpha/beta hydrolase [Mycobacterium sp.]
MVNPIDISKFNERATTDKELAYNFRDYTGTIRAEIGIQKVDVIIQDGIVTGVTENGAEEPRVTITAPDEFWEAAFEPGVPRPGYESLTIAGQKGLVTSGDFKDTIAPYQLALQRLYQVLRASVAGDVERKPQINPFKDTDNAIGRYAYVTSNGVESRIYYEQAGHGPIPILLQATAGADGRQYRHLLADPAMQERFTMYAYDLPYHGKSLPPENVRWWEQKYTITRDEIVAWVVAIADALELEQPYFMGCSVGGQLALDLAAEAPERFGAFISLNGWWDTPVSGFSNDPFRTPAVSPDFFPAMNYGATGPQAPEHYAHELYWIYRANFGGIYAGDNDYFMFGHNLNENGHKIDAHAKPVYCVTGEYDPASDSQEHGAPAVARNIPGVVHYIAKGMGHFAPSDDPIGFSEFIVPVLDEVIEKAAKAATPA